MKMSKKTKTIIITISIIVLAMILVLVVGNSFGFFKYIKKGDIVNVITIKGIDVKILNDEDDALNLENAYPISDSEGMLSTPFEFSMTNTSSRTITYSIKVENDTEKQEACKLEDGSTCPVLTTDYIKYSYKKDDGTYSEPKLLSSTNNIISTGELSINETITSSLILWIDSEAGNEIQNHYFFGKLIVTGEQIITRFLQDAILSDNKLIEDIPDLTTSSNNTNDPSGLYKSTSTNSGDPTYYFRGAVENNYIDFAGFTWRIVRINEDGTIRIIMQDGINNNATYKFNPTYNEYTYMYYSNSNVENGAKYILDNWYNTNIASNPTYANRVVTGEYFCEEAKVKYSSSYTSGNATMQVYSSYIPDFTCEKNGKDGNNKGLVNASIGMLTYDEVLHAGGYYNKSNVDYYLNNNTTYLWTMSPSGFNSYNFATAWLVTSTGYLYDCHVTDAVALRPVINLKSDVWVTGNGTSSNPYEIDDTHKISVKETDNLSIGTAVEAIDGSKWHVLEESNSDSKYVILLSDYNLNSDGTYNTDCGRDINSTYVCSAMDFGTNNTYNESDTSNIGYFMKNTYKPLVTSSLNGTNSVTLPTAAQIANADGKVFNNEYLSITNSWLLSTNYWTITPHTNASLEYVVVGDYYSGYNLNAYYTNGSNASYGVRPVITTLKTNLIYN